MVVFGVVAVGSALGGVATVRYALSPSRRAAEALAAQQRAASRRPGGAPLEIDVRGTRETSREGGDGSSTVS
jgi:hypothetical protein